MPKRKGLGRDVTKSLEIMEDLHKALGIFEKAPIKEGLRINKALDDKMATLVNETKESALKLQHMIEDLRNKVSNVPTGQDSRFSRNASMVVQKFLERVN